jgi:arylsulfatase A
MNRRQFLRCMTAVGMTAAAPWAVGQEQKKLNVVLILVDDMGWADVGCDGSKFYETPNIDRLAREGMRFTDGYAACPVCSPTRASIMTGHAPARLHLTDFLVGTRWPKDSPITPIKDWQKFLPESEITLPQMLKSVGYVTGHIGKWHLGKGQPPEYRGFDVNVAGGEWGSPPSYFSPYKNNKIADGPVGEYLTDRLEAEAEKFIESNKDRAFFLQLAHYGVHIPLRAKADLIERYKGKPEEHGQKNATYAAMIQSVDEGVGRMLKKLDDLGIADRTVVIFTSDNGGLSVPEGGPTPTSNAPLRDGKGYLYEGGIRVPWIVKWPGVTKAGSVCSTPIISTDLMASVGEMTGAKPPAGLDGVSFVPLLRGGEIQREALYWHYPHYSNQGGRPGGAIRMGDWKLIERYEDASVELYNLKQDLGETTNLAKQMPEKAKELRERLDGWRKSVGAQMPGRKGA